MLERAIAEGHPFICLSVCLSHSWATPIRFKTSTYFSYGTTERCF